ncbi:hypothetical protein L207DRAFT_425298 [Hyaloscypha variabilis F]|uniref:Rhodopsin domain-containing protein n=1 Tax=Hyaloscypha variabilis (strain UAMH 11265 / GT02V1 / F) TaxID=1149755 RepID=A0A2J6RWA8_HYAVF|nr:hypothetical protein L207DRAFT_425298 [Hyaloscypha variabilis F]
MYISVQTLESWPAPNYVDPQTRGNSVIVINSILYGLVLGVVGLRIFTRTCISRSFGYDDAFILLAMLPTTAFVAVMLMAQVKYGWNRHAWDVLPSTVAIGEKLALATQILFAVASTCTRLSMLFLTRRILAAGYRRLQKLTTFAMVFMSADCLIFAVICVFQCRPISAYWTLSFVPQHCISERIHLVIQGSFNIASDFCVVLIPIPIVLKLNLPLRQRIIVALLFGAGFVVCFAGIVRTYYLYRITDDNRDVTWDAYPVWLGSAVELYLGIVCCSAPPTKPFFACYVPKLLFTASHGSQNLTYTSSQNKTFNPIHSYSSREREVNAGMEFESLPERGDSMKKRSEICKTVEVEIEVEQSWVDTPMTPRTPGSSTAESFMKLLH